MPVTEAYVRKVFELVSSSESPDWDAFLACIRDDVDWVVSNANARSFPIAGRYDKAGFLNAVAPLMQSFKNPLSLQIERITLSGDVAAVEMRSVNVGIKDGKTFDNSYVWMVEFEPSTSDSTAEPKIKAIKEYFDSALHAIFLKSNVGLEI